MKHILIQTTLFAVLCTSKSYAQGAGSASLWGTGNTTGGSYSATGGIRCGTAANTGTCSMAFGYESTATAFASFAQGQNVYATASNAAAFGAYSNAHGIYSFAQGLTANANGESSLAIGQNATAHDWMNRAFGYMSVAGDSSPTINFGHCYAFGSQSIAKNNNTVALGASSQATGEDSKAVGLSSVASGKSAVTLGETSTASGNQSTAIGQGSKALALHSVAAGPFPVARGNPATWVSSDPVFTVANGQSDAARSNAIVVLKSGAVLVKPAGDLSMGVFTAGIRPDDTTP